MLFAFVEVVVVVVVVVVVEVVIVVVVVVVVVVVGRGSRLGLDPLAWPLAAWSLFLHFALFRALSLLSGFVSRASRIGVLGGALGGALGVYFLGGFGRGWWLGPWRWQDADFGGRLGGGCL